MTLYIHIKSGAKSNANSITFCSKFLHMISEPVMATNTSKSSTCISILAPLESMMLECKAAIHGIIIDQASISILFSNNTLTAYNVFFSSSVILTAELLDLLSV